MTPRPSKDPNKIKYVSLVRGRWVFRPYVKKGEREGLDVDRNGFLTPIKLGIEADPWHRIVKAYAAAYAEIQAGGERSKLTLRWIADEYEKSPAYDKLKLSSRKKIRSLRRIVETQITINGRAGTLGSLYTHEISVQYMTRLRDQRLRELQSAGFSGHSQANREMNYLSRLASWASQRFETVTTNPFKVESLDESVRDRYVTDDEYERQLLEAAKYLDWLPVLMELTYLTAARGCESLNLKLSDVGKDTEGRPAILVRRTKGSKPTYIQITPRLQAAVDAAKALHKTRKVSGLYLVPGTRQKARISQDGLQSAMRRLRERMGRDHMSIHRHGIEIDDTESPLFWNMHDLKRKGVTDAKDNRIAGHRSDRVREAYTVLAQSFEAPR
jgi:integrase